MQGADGTSGAAVVIITSMSIAVSWKRKVEVVFRFETIGDSLCIQLASCGNVRAAAGFGGADFLAVAVFLVGEKKRSDTSYVRPKSDSGRECSCSSGRRSELLSSLEASLKLIGCTHSKSSLFALASVVVFVFFFCLSLLFFKAVLTSKKHQATCCVLWLHAQLPAGLRSWIGYMTILLVTITDPARRVAVRVLSFPTSPSYLPWPPPHRCLSNVVYIYI